MWHDVVLVHIGFNKIFRVTLNPSPHEMVRDDEHSKSGRKLMLRPEHKGVAMMNNLVQKFWKLEELVLDLLGCVLWRAKASLLVKKHIIHVGCEQDVGCLEK